LEETVRKMTSQPAGRVHLNGRGILRPGMAADITVLDPATIADKGTYKDPNHYAVGIRHVIVNGQLTVLEGKITEARAGRFAQSNRAPFRFALCRIAPQRSAWHRSAPPSRAPIKGGAA